MHHVRIAGSLAIGAVLMIGGCGDPADRTPSDAAGFSGGWSTAGCEFARAPEHVTDGGVVMPTTPADLRVVMERIEQTGRADFADSYAGLEVDQERVRALVYRVPSASFDEFVRQTAGHSCVVVRDAAHSATDLAVWHDRLLADLAFWASQGIRIATIGARHDGTGVEIGTPDVDRAERELPAHYGERAPLIFVLQGPVKPLTTLVRPGS
jgi:hypothetical protein